MRDYPKLPDGHPASAYQRAAFDWVEHGTGHAIIKAVAGSGKTTTLEWLAKSLPIEGISVAFNKHIATELNRRLKDTSMIAKTIHSLGYAMCSQHVGRLTVKGNKYNRMVRDAVRRMTQYDRAEQQRLTSTLSQMVDKLRVTLTDLDDETAIAHTLRHFNLYPDPALTFEARQIIRQGASTARTQRLVDFTDMVYLPVLWNLSGPRVQWITVDESQDLNACQFEIVKRHLAPTGRMLFVGDAAQAIYGFAGADSEMMRRIEVELDATNLPLSICYRCPVEVVQLAKPLVAEIEHRPGAPAGIVDSISADRVDEKLQPQDLILCRVNSPLVRKTIQLIKDGRSASMKGRDIGKGLVRLLGQITGDYLLPFDMLPQIAEAYRQRELIALEKKDASETAVESLNDRVDCLIVCYADLGATTYANLAEKIEDLFRDKGSMIYLSSVHRAKGLESERVFILCPEKMPLEWPDQKDWELQQEKNLLYVAITRSKSELWTITS